MRVRKISNNLVQLTALKFFNCYLVRDPDGCTLVDTLSAGSGDAILKAADRFGPIRRILLTHAHFDHVGALDELAARLPEVPVLMSARDARFLPGDISLDPREPHTNLKGPGRIGNFPQKKTRPDRFLANGVYIGPLRVIATPGHTPGHISLLDVRDGTLISGDAYQTQGGVSTTVLINPFFPIPGMATWNPEFAYRSALHLRSFAPERLAPGHGPVVEKPLAKMDSALHKAEKELRHYRAA
jgi:glyoxylase-like metal-dependent hydrolase (beta-lactamase superfamily II)